LKKKLNFDLSKIVFLIVLAITLLIVGGEVANRGWQPYKFYSEGKAAVKGLLKQSAQTRPDILEKIRYQGDGVTHFEHENTNGGLTLIQGWFKEGLEIRLIDMTGTILHKWPLDIFKIWPDPSSIYKRLKDIPATVFNTHTQGMWMLPDGSVIVNLAGLVKFDKCGNIVWRLDRQVHHAITPNSDGTLWVLANKSNLEIPGRMLIPRVTYDEIRKSGDEYQDVLLLVSEKGKILREISLLEAIINGDFENKLYDMSQIDKLDPTHVNDIEVVTSALASKVDGVNKGDLLVSVRQMHMLVILDKDSGVIKWHRIGPWVRQHDPDITAEGTIEIFNNRDMYDSPGLNRNKTPGSNIISLDPATGVTKIIYPLKGQASFYSHIMGTHQLMKNGNRLITESTAGRLFEINKEGKIVWEYIKPYDDAYASLMESAIRYSNDYLNVTDWSCSR